MSSNAARLADVGQSVWYDNLHRDLIRGGGLRDLINHHGVRGVTSNPTIFEKAILSGGAYDQQLAGLRSATPEEAYWELVVEDIAGAADVLASTYETTQGSDGFVSVEVTPSLAHDATGTVEQAHQLWERVARPNVMIKVPATVAGVGAVEALTFAGVNVNVTLIFSVERYRDVLAAYTRGLTQRTEAGLHIGSVRSVASFFVSRLDTAIDPLLPADHPSRGRCAVANARVAYQAFTDYVSAPPWTDLMTTHGASVQRPLWASTSTKNVAYSPTLYVDELIGRSTVNTLAPGTLDAFESNGSVVADTIETDLHGAHDVLGALHEAGVDLDAVTADLERAGVQAFVDSFESCVAGIAKRMG